jgi:hypothetical protein
MSEGPGINSKAVEDDLKLLADLIRDGELWSVDPSTLTRLLNALCIAKTGTSSCALHIVQGLVVNHEQMVRHLTKLDAANGRTQRWFIAFAVLSLAGLSVQIYRDLTAERIVVVSSTPSQPRLPDDTNDETAASKVDPTKPAPARPRE